MSDAAGQQVLGEREIEQSSTAAASGRSRATQHRRWWPDALRRRLLALADVVATGAATALITIPIVDSVLPLLLIPVWLLIAKLFGLYDRDHRALRHLTADEVPSILGWSATITAFTALLLPPLSDSALGTGSALLHFGVVGLGAIATRSLARKAWWIRTPPELIGVIGDPEGLEAVRRKLKIFRDMHFEIASEQRIEELDEPERRAERLVRLSDQVDRIVLCTGEVETELIEQLNALCRARQVKLSVVPPLRGKALPSPQIERVADLPVLEYNTWDPSRSSLTIKRSFDLAASGLGLAVLAPLMPLVALAIRLDSSGPVLFSQVRAGLGGRPFRMYKLRTMQADAEEQLDEVVDLDQLEQPAFKLRDDPRITRVGRWLRRLSLDELPQLWNVFVGEMSIVGPRPEQVELVQRYSPEDRVRLTVKPGITGPMQIFGRGELTFQERLTVELEYVENQSLGRDLRILIHTLPAVTRGTGAY